MKRNQPQRLASFLPKPKNRLSLQQLESRDVPAVFFVDPTYVGGAPLNNYSGDAGANFFQATPANTFAGLDGAIAAAAGNAEADTIFLANNPVGPTPFIVIPNVGGVPITINDNLTFVGGGASNTTLVVGFNVVGPVNETSVFDTLDGSSLNLQDFTYNGGGVKAATAFYYQGSTSTVKGVDFIGYGTANNGQAIAAAFGSNISITGGTFTNTQGRSGVTAYSDDLDKTTLTVNGTTFVGSASHDSYGVEVFGNASANIATSTFNGHTGDSAGGSAGILVYQDTNFSTISPEATILRNVFTNNTVAVAVGLPGAVGDKSSALIAYNNITGSGEYSIQGNTVNNGQVVNARFNWFGSASGPSGLSGTLGVVNTSQFLRAPLGTVESAAVSNNARFVTAPNSTAAGNPLGQNTNGTFAAQSTPTGKSYPLRNSAGTLVAETGETRAAFVDLNGDGFNEIIVSSGSSELVSIYNGVGGVWMKSFSGLTLGNTPAKFAGGVYVAGGDINGDGTRDLIVSQGAFDPRIVVWNGKTVLMAAPTRIVDFIDATNRGNLGMGVTVAAGDFNGDGFDDIVTGAIQPLASTPINSNVRVFDGKALLTNPQATPNANPALALSRITDSVAPNVDFFAYIGSATGVYVAAADVNGDGRAELVTGAARLGANLKAFTFTAGSILAPTAFVSGSTTPTLAADFLVGATGAGVRVAARDLNNDGYADILWTLGTGAPPVGVISGQSLTLTGPASGITPPVAPVGFTLLTAAYTAASKGAFVA